MSDFPDTPTHLLTRIAAEVSGIDDAAAWSEFFGLYEPAMRRFLVARGFSIDVEDAVQRVFAKLVVLLREGRYDRARGSFRAYLATILSNEMIGMLRHASARAAERHVPIDAVDVPVFNDPAAELEQAWRAAVRDAVVRHVLDRTALAKQSKEIYEDIRGTGDTCTAVAARHGVTAAAVRQIKSRIDRMVAALERRYGI